MSTEQNKQIVRRYFVAHAANDQDTLNELLHPALVAFTNSPDPKNREVYMQGAHMWSQAFGDTEFDIQEQIAENDKVVTHAILRAVHDRGEFQGLPPTGKEIAIHGMILTRVTDGRMVEIRIVSDWFGMMQQLGLVPTQ